jgi:putative DNA primase/helicase
VFNRLADNWRPLFAIAEIAGGDWPKRCADASAKLTCRDSDDCESLRILLLADIREILAGEWPLLEDGEGPMPVERTFSKTLVEQICSMTERPWPEARRGKPVSEQWMAKQLANFRIHSKTLRIGEERAKGYEPGQFSNAFARYLPIEGDSSRDAVTYEGKSLFRPVTKTGNVTARRMAIVMRTADKIAAIPIAKSKIPVHRRHQSIAESRSGFPLRSHGATRAPIYAHQK